MKVCNSFLVLIGLTVIGCPVYAHFIPLTDGMKEQDAVTWNIQDVENGLRITMEFPGASVRKVEREGITFAELSIRGCGLKGETGSPYLPFKGMFVEIPSGVEPGIKFNARDSLLLPGTYEVLPSQPPLPEGYDRNQAPQFIYDESAYSIDVYSPEDLIKITEDGYIRGRRVLFLEISPLQYNPVSNSLKGYPAIDFTITYRGVQNPAAQANKLRLACPEFENQAAGVIANYKPVDMSQKSRSRDGADYLIITYDDFEDELAPLVEWKTLKGRLTELATLSDIGGSTPAVIQSYLQDAYDTWDPAPAYVLLVGDVQQVPSNNISGDLTDLPYSCLEGGDSFADLFLGRLNVQTEEQCTVVVNKLLDFDRNPEVADWYNHGLAAALFQDSWSPYCEADRWFFETATHVMQYLDQEIGMSMYSAYCTDASGCSTYHFRSDSYPHRFDWPDPVPQELIDLITPASQATQNIIDAFNSGVSIVQHRDHGEPSGWSDPPFYVSDLGALENGNRTPVVFSINCSSGDMDYGSDCFAEAILKKDGGGAVSVIAASETSYSGHNDLMVHGFYTCFWPDYDPEHTGNIYENAYQMGASLNFGKYYMFMYQGSGSYTPTTLRIFHLFGDPELMIRTDTPQDPDIDLPVTIPTGTSSVTMDITDNGALVAISQEGELLGSGIASNGQVEIELDGQIQAGVDVDIVVTGYNLNPLEASVLSSAPQCGIVQYMNSNYNCSSAVTLRVLDSDLNLDPYVAEQVMIDVWSDSDPTGISVECTEIDPDLAVFEGQFELFASGGSGDLLVAHGDDVTAYYHDDDCEGSPVDVYEDVTVDCQEPAISGVGFSGVLDTEAVITWTTDELATATVFYGFDTPPVQSVSCSEYSMEHSIKLEGLENCSKYYFYVESTDLAENTATDDNSGEYYFFNTLGNFVLFEENMDSNPGWTISGGDWEWGIPTGQGGDYGGPDPTSGYTGDNVYGYNLNGDYTNSMGEYHLTAPVMDCSAAAGTTLRFYRWLGVEQPVYDHAVISVSVDGTTFEEVWHNSSTIYDGEWLYCEYDISEWADGQPEVYVRWTMGPTDSGWTYCGWNIDDVEVGYLGPCDVPILIHESHVIDDSSGNDNGEPNPGETITCPITLYNNSGIDAAGINVTVSENSDYVTLINADLTFPDMPAHTSAESDQPHLQWQIDASAPDGESIQFSLAWTSVEGSGNANFNEMITAPALSYQDHLVDDSSGNDDGIADPGENIVLPVSLLNTGHGIAPAPYAELSTDSIYIDITDNSASWPDLEYEQMEWSTDDFGFYVDPDAPEGEMVEFSMFVETEGFSDTVNFTVGIGAQPVLVIADGTHQHTQSFVDTLAGNGFLVTEETASSTDPAYWDNYAFIVWSSGDNSSPVSQAGWRDNLTAYVGDGGTLLIEGGEICYDFYYSAPDFLEDVCHVTDWNGDSSGDLSLEASDHPIVMTPYSLPSTISHTYSSYYDEDACDAAIDATTIFGWTSANGGGVIAYDDDTDPWNGGQTVFYSFTIGDVQNQTDKEHLIVNTARWLSGTGGTAPTATPFQTPIPPTYTPTGTPTLIPSCTPTRTPTQIPPTLTPTCTPTQTPTDVPPTYTPTDTPTHIPTEIPTWFVTGTPTAHTTGTPTAVCSPTPTSLEMKLMINQEMFHAEDPFLLECRIVNPHEAVTFNQFVILDVYDNYWFYESWSTDIDWVVKEIPAYCDNTEVILEFVWPTNAGTAYGLKFWGALVDNQWNLMTDISVLDWGYE